ncbi:hypothetical protein [Planktosalinus lacus]|uniref:Uncharacterized protein n=1 Tax=Planktosalinus lacus TaxID=1526573 RepID=A0A8J2V8H7_9FLAO|nr:hypothetical protein [Planktosalinus lacus]GGD84630.1 hypothetical protein GCM10011312_05830 [Planktosalinus lacus]
MKTLLSLFCCYLLLTPSLPPVAIPDAHSSATMINLKLNDGEKWPTDEVTTNHIQSMIDLCEAALSQRTYAVAPLHEALTQEIDALNQNTQMSGDARAQLHNYQLGLRKRIEALSENRGTVEWLLHELKRFTDYFE